MISSNLRTNRRQFLIFTMGTALLTACGSSHADGSGEPPNGEDADCTAGAEAVYVNPGHRHTTLVLTAEQIAAAVPGPYQLFGGGTHNHTFQLEAEDFVALAEGRMVEKVDLEGDGHIMRLGC